MSGGWLRAEPTGAVWTNDGRLQGGLGACLYLFCVQLLGVGLSLRWKFENCRDGEVLNRCTYEGGLWAARLSLPHMNVYFVGLAGRSRGHAKRCRTCVCVLCVC